MSYKNTYMKKTTDLKDYKDVKGHDFEAKLDFKEFLNSYLTTGFQATNLGKAFNILHSFKDSFTILAFTGNAISSGVREQITYLAKHKKIDLIITSASGIEEDVIKSLETFKIGSYEVPGNILFDYGVGRIGNIFVPNDRYLYFEKFMKDIFPKLGKKTTPTKIAKLLGENLKEDSYLYWASKNGIPVFCPGIIDGSFGDLSYFYSKQNEFEIDIVEDHKIIMDLILNQEKTSAIILGGGIPKHYALNANILREGLDHAIYLTTANEFDGSDSGGNEEEAKTWAKIKINGSHVKVNADFTITFPLIVAYMKLNI